MFFKSNKIKKFKANKITRKSIQQVAYFMHFFRDLPQGDIIECGVGKGRSFTILCTLRDLYYPNKKVYGLDSFEGFPEPTPEDNSHRNPKKGDTWKLIHEIYPIKELLAECSNYVLVKGFFKDTISTLNVKEISLLHIDVDLYESYRECLKLYPRVLTGGYIVFDEYGTDKWPGATKAIDEFVKANGEKLESRDGKYFIQKK